MKKFLVSAVLSIFAVFNFTGCYDAIYQSIRKEVELEEGTVSGFINNIARYDAPSGNKYLFLTNGLVQYKDASVSSHGAWNEVSGNGLPKSLSYDYWNETFNGEFFYKIAADENNIYVISFKPEYDSDHSRNVPVKFYLYTGTVTEDTETKTLSISWQLSEDISDEINRYSSSLDTNNYKMDFSVHLFCTNTVNKENRKAYIRIGGGSPYAENSENNSWVIYKLNGTSAEEVRRCTYDSTAKTYTYSNDTNPEATRYTLSAVYFNEDVHFLNYLNAETNEGTLNHTDKASYVYYGDNGTYLNSFNVSDYARADNIKVMKNSWDTPSATVEEITMNAFSAYFCNYYKCSVTENEDGTTTYTKKAVELPENFVKSSLAKGNIISIAVTNDSLLLGTGYNRSTGSSSGSGDGIFRVNISEDGKPETKTSSFSTNADSVMCSPYHVKMLFCFNPDQNETSADIYSAVDYIYTESSSGTSISNRGLWAYFPSRGNWNRE